MREILFRGKRVDNGEWVEGYLVKKIDPLLYIGKWFILTQEYDTSCIDGSPTTLKVAMTWYKVDPKTAGQFTGLYDKNAKKIFEGDIVKGKDYLEKALEVYGYIDHRNGSFVIVGDFMTHYRWLDYEVEVIGNIHDNPELLKEGAEE